MEANVIIPPNPRYVVVAVQPDPSTPLISPALGRSEELNQRTERKCCKCCDPVLACLIVPVVVCCASFIAASGLIILNNGNPQEAKISLIALSAFSFLYSCVSRVVVGCCENTRFYKCICRD